MSQAEALALLNPHLPAFRDIFARAWEHYIGQYDVSLRLDHSKRSRASIVHDLMARFARERFEGKTGIMLRKVRGLFLVEIAGKLLVRFKKLDRSGRPRNVLTNQTELFLGQQLRLPGIEGATAVVAGYQLDTLEQSMSTRLMTCLVGDTAWWTFNLDGSSEEGPAALSEITTRPPKAPKVRPKRTAKRKRKSAE